MDRWRGRVAVVTGASAGIGASIAQTLALQGMKVVACARRLDRLVKLSHEVSKSKASGIIVPYKCDLNDMNNIKDMFDWIENHQELGRVDVCVCNAGVDIHKGLNELTPEEMKQMMNVNVISSNYCTQLSIKLMLKKEIDDGQIIFISR